MFANSAHETVLVSAMTFPDNLTRITGETNAQQTAYSSNDIQLLDALLCTGVVLLLMVIVLVICMVEYIRCQFEIAEMATYYGENVYQVPKYENSPDDSDLVSYLAVPWVCSETGTGSTLKKWFIIEMDVLNETQLIIPHKFKHLIM